MGRERNLRLERFKSIPSVLWVTVGRFRNEDPYGGGVFGEFDSRLV